MLGVQTCTGLHFLREIYSIGKGTNSLNFDFKYVSITWQPYWKLKSSYLVTSYFVKFQHSGALLLYF